MEQRGSQRDGIHVKMAGAAKLLRFRYYRIYGSGTTRRDSLNQMSNPAE
jgi:hypothetical protein